MTLQAIVFLAVATAVGYVVHRREGIGAGVTAAAAVVGVLCLLLWNGPASTPSPPTAPEGAAARQPRASEAASTATEQDI